MAKSIFFLLLLIGSSIRITNAQLSSQNVKEKLEEAEEYILSEDYKEALSIFDELNAKGYDNSNVEYKKGLCYLNIVAEQSKALPLLKNSTLHISKSYNSANLMEEAAPVEAMLYLGDAYRIMNRISEAIKCYRNYSVLAASNQAKTISDKRIKESHIARVLQSKPIAVKWEQLSSDINQGIGNLNPVLSADGNTLIFTRKMKFYDAIYYTHYSGNEWSEPVNITTQLGSDGEFYPTALSADGKKLLLSSFEMLTGQDIYESTWNGSRWSKRKKLDEGVNSNFAEITASYSPDGNTIFFASNRDNGYGGFDIYKSEKRADNSWSHAINLGPAVNTKSDEKAPHLFNNGSQLAFSSQGHLNMGGMDLFYINYPLEPGSKVLNFGSPLNTVIDDLSFYPVLNQNSAFMAKHHAEGEGETDIFKVDYTSLSNFTEIPVKTILEVTGVTEKDSLAFFLVDASVNDTIDQRSSTKENLPNSYSLYPGKFILIAQSPSKETETARFDVPDNVTEKVFQVPVTIAFKDVETSQKEIASVAKGDTLKKPGVSNVNAIIVKNIHFAFNSYELVSEYYPVLDEIATYLKANPKVTVIITGYTDSVGTYDYNQKLSEKRAIQVLEYLKKKNISTQRMKTIGAGSTKFIATNTKADGSDSEEGRQMNRRVEFEFKNTPEGFRPL
jgi:outer membrane protein OmpA-like peptidoglycan-associated protein/Tol biopolymer transport system component